MTATSKPLDLAQFEASPRHVQELHANHAALLAECRRLQADNAKLREALDSAAAYLDGAGIKPESKRAAVIAQARAALKASKPLDLDQYDPARTIRDLSEYCLRQPNEAAQLIHKLRVENETHRKRLTADLSIDKATLREQIAALLPAVQIAYTILADIRHQWNGRHTVEGQGALCAMRDAICAATGRDAEEVQDDYTNARAAL